MLRAYYLWYKNEEMDAVNVAGVLRDPPLSTATVVGYIDGAIRLDRLPYEVRRLKEQVLDKLPDGVGRLPRYRELAKLCSMGRSNEGMVEQER